MKQVILFSVLQLRNKKFPVFVNNAEEQFKFSVQILESLVCFWSLVDETT